MRTAEDDRELSSERYPCFLYNQSLMDFGHMVVTFHRQPWFIVMKITFTWHTRLPESVPGTEAADAIYQGGQNALQ